jgi:uncharacterized protein YbjQ (UPF0145 family)
MVSAVPQTKPGDHTSQFDRIAHGGLASSTEARLGELVGWGGFSSFLSPKELSVGAAAGVRPLGQVVGLSAGGIRLGYVRTTRPGQGRPRAGVARWRESTGPVRSWAELRERALGRLVKQATILGADAVIGVRPKRELADGEEYPIARLTFSGTAVSVEGWKGRRGKPVVTLVSAQDLWAMLARGIEPAGIVGGFASVSTHLGSATIAATRRWGRPPNIELDDLTTAVYETRRLALQRLAAQARSLGAHGVIGISLDLEPSSRVARSQAVTCHVLASAIRRSQHSRRPPYEVVPVVGLSERSGG